MDIDVGRLSELVVRQVFVKVPRDKADLVKVPADGADPLIR